MNNDDELDRILQHGIYGAPVLKREEKQLYLGEYRERVVAAIRHDQVMNEEILKQVEALLRSKQATKVKIHGDLAYETAQHYRQLAMRFGQRHNTVSFPGCKRKYAVVLASHRAVEQEDIHLTTRKDRLLVRGVPEAIIEAKGKELCDTCRETLEEKAPDELRHYRSLSFLDKLLGKRCAVCGKR